MNQLCRVCGEPAAGFHFGAFTCEGCKSFFGRTCNNMSSLGDCKNGGSCIITRKNRTACKACRLRKCLGVGMSKSGSRYGRRSNWFKIHCLLQDSNNQNTEESIEKAKKLLEEIKVANLKSSQDPSCQKEIKKESSNTLQEGSDSPTPTVSSTDVLESAADSLLSTPPPFSWFNPESSPVPAEALSLFAALSPFLFTAGLGIQSSSSHSQLPNFSQYYPYLLSQISNASSSSSSTSSSSSNSPSSATSSPFFMKPSNNRDEELLVNASFSEDEKLRGLKDEKIILEPLNLRANVLLSLPSSIQNDKFLTFKSGSTCSPDQSGRNSDHEYDIKSETTKRKEVQVFPKQEISRLKDHGFKRSYSPATESYENSSKRRKSLESNSPFYCDSEGSKDNINIATITQTNERHHHNNKSSQERKFTHEKVFLHGHKHFQLQDHEQNEPIDLSIKTCSLPPNNICFRTSKDSDTECSNVLACSMTLTPISSSVQENLSNDARVEQSSNAIDLSCRV